LTRVYGTEKIKESGKLSPFKKGESFFLVDFIFCSKGRGLNGRNGKTKSN
jgi:hypothetical protein